MNALRTFSGLTLALALLSTGSFVAARADGARLDVVGNRPRDAITVKMEEATLSFVIENLGQKNGFEVNGLQHLPVADPISAQMSGSLYVVLERLLRNSNHVIVRSANNASGVERIIVLDANYGTKPGFVPVPGQNATASGPVAEAYPSPAPAPQLSQPPVEGRAYR